MKNSITTSIPAARKVRGYTITRMPIGRFLNAMQLLNELPENIIMQMFPQSENPLAQLKTLTKTDLQSIVIRAFTVLPAEAVRIFSELAGIEAGELLDDPNVGMDGLAEMALAWVEVNGLENFMNAVRTLMGQVRTEIAMPGSKR